MDYLGSSSVGEWIGKAWLKEGVVSSLIILLGKRASAPDHTTSEISRKTLELGNFLQKIVEKYLTPFYREFLPNIMRWSEVVLNKPQDWNF